MCLLAWLTMIGSLLARTAEDRLFRCPVCETQFRDVVDASGTQIGMRLDFKPIGSIGTPGRLAKCPRCRFITMIRGELYRRLRMFNEAESWFKASACQSEHRFCDGLVAQQLTWIASKDSKPHEFKRHKQ